MFIERAEKLVTVDESNKRDQNPAEYKTNLRKPDKKALILDSKLPINEQMKMRRNSSESAASAYRRRRTFGEKLFLTKHTQGRGRPYVFVVYFSNVRK